MAAELAVGCFCESDLAFADTRMCCQFIAGSHLAGRIQLCVYSLGAESQQEVLSRAHNSLLWEKLFYCDVISGHPGLISQANSFISFVPRS